VPETLAAWHVRNAVLSPDINGGANKVNHWSLGIEVVNTQKNDPFSPWQIEATAKIVRYCWAKYPNLAHVVSHAVLDPERRTDPGADYDWVRFKALVLEAADDPIAALVAAATPAAKVKKSKALGCWKA
jgi:N-acetylmuramoyl-L-alanine amidase